MHVSAGSGQPPAGPDWVVELAWTGHRCIAYVDPTREPGKRVRLLSANAVSMTATYPELAEPLERHSPPRGMVLDGTVVARGEEHAPRARRLAKRSGLHRPSEAHIRSVPVDYQVCDLLWLDGHSTLDLPYRDRRALLDGLGFDTAPVWSTSPLPLSELDTMLRIAEAKGVDALHARHLGARYRPGGRSPLWVKVPVPRVRQVVVGGWTPTDVRRPDTIASLLLGIPDGAGGLRYVGRVGVTGEERRRLSVLVRRRRPLSPFSGTVPDDVARHAVWVAPELVGEVEFTGFAANGRLRLPRWLGLVDRAERLDPADLHGPAAASARWARPEPPSTDLTPPAEPQPEPDAQGEPEPEPEPEAAPPPPRKAESPRRLEQHFVYNALNTIAALIRTDPMRARELLFGFADLSRAADQPGDSRTRLSTELDAVRGYLALEQARFGARLQVEIDVPQELHGLSVSPMALIDAVRAAVQRDIEPLPEGGLLKVTAVRVGAGAELHVRAGDRDPVVVTAVPLGATV
jgi:ATP-dependent DNA ligase